MSAIAAPPSYILNGAGFGDVASRLMSSGMDPRVLRPWIGKDGCSQFITQNDEHGKPYSQPVMNTGALLRKDDWLALDQAIAHETAAIDSFSSFGIVRRPEHIVDVIAAEERG